MIDLNPILEAVISLAVALITAYVIPYIKNKLNEKQFDSLQMWVQIAVMAAEQIFAGDKRGAEKKQYVMEFLQNKGFKVDLDSLDTLVEAAVKELTA